MQYGKDVAKILVTREEIQKRIAELADEINRDYTEMLGRRNDHHILLYLEEISVKLTATYSTIPGKKGHQSWRRGFGFGARYKICRTIHVLCDPN